MKFHLIKHEGVFKAADHDSEDAIKKVSEGEVVQAKSIDQRNYEFHKKYFALINIAWQNLPERFDSYFGTSDDLRKELTKLAGFYNERKDFHGNTIKEPESIAFDKMSPERFEKLYDATLDLVAKLLKTDNPTLERQIMEFL
jgi:hypothetical protein